jgi:hypothetical protein
MMEFIFRIICRPFLPSLAGRCASSEYLDEVAQPVFLSLMLFDTSVGIKNYGSEKSAAIAAPSNKAGQRRLP